MPGVTVAIRDTAHQAETMGYTMGQAAKAAAVSKTTILRAIKAGRLSAVRHEDGSYTIDPSELQRAFPQNGHENPQMARFVTASETGALQAEVAMLRERLAEKDDVIVDLRRRLDQADEERRQAQAQLRGLLTDQRPPPERRSWWPWRRG